MEEQSLPGARLRRAREDKGISSEDVSRRLHLSRSYLNALENDEYDKLPEPAFIKGYFRNYARLLGLAGDDIADLYQARLDSERADMEEHRSRTADASRRRGTNGRLMVLLILVVILVVVLAWWVWPQRHAFFPLDHSGEQSSDVLSSPDDAGTALTTEKHRDQPVVDTGVPLGQSADAVPAPTASDAPQTTASPQPADEALASAGIESLDDGDETQGLSRPASTGSAEQQGEPQDQSGAGDEAVTTEAGRAALTMSFSRVCWVSVVDDNGEKLISGTQAAGSSLDLQGKAPFQVTIGDAGAVSAVAVDGSPASLPSQRSGDVLHVTLP